MRKIKLTVEQQPNGTLSLWIQDEALGKEGLHRGGYALAENRDHASFYRAAARGIADYASVGDQVTYIDHNN